jgi:ubiquinone/menaquinone biosynthesis C-methylase UbiE
MIARQFANPRGLVGHLVGMAMARANATLTRRVVEALELNGDETVLEIGPGPGVGLRLLAKALPAGRVYAAEPSSVMRSQAAARIRRFADRVELIDATAETIVAPPGTFDAVCAVNNVQLWQPLASSLAHVFDVLAPGRLLALGVTERAVLPDGSAAGRAFDTQLLPHLERAGFRDLDAKWARGGNGHELLVLARRPAS